jgi:glucose-6-phosphate 1-epimerase
MNVSELNEEFSLDGILDITEAHSGFPVIKINNQYASAVISLYGGQVLSYVQRDAEELLFLSDKAFYETGKAIKGGVPVCWPWFGADPQGKGRPAHGFARNSLWQLESTEQTISGSTKVVISLLPNEASKKLFPYKFKLSLTVVVGKEIELELTTQNTDEKSFNITQALHTYFAVKNIKDVSVSGLDGNVYLDKAKSKIGEENKAQKGDVVFGGEVDRIYLDVPNNLQIRQKDAKKLTTILSINNKTAVVWNPWKELCEQSVDLKPDDYTRFVCVETANSADNVIEVKSGEVFSLHVTYSIA